MISGLNHSTTHGVVIVYYALDKVASYTGSRLNVTLWTVDHDPI